MNNGFSSDGLVSSHPISTVCSTTIYHKERKKLDKDTKKILTTLLPRFGLSVLIAVVVVFALGWVGGLLPPAFRQSMQQNKFLAGVIAVVIIAVLGGAPIYFILLHKRSDREKRLLSRLSWVLVGLFLVIWMIATPNETDPMRNPWAVLFLAFAMIALFNDWTKKSSK